MNKYISLARVIEAMALGTQLSTPQDYRSLESKIRGVMRPQNLQVVKKRITDSEELTDDELEHSRAADLQKKSKIIDNP